MTPYREIMTNIGQAVAASQSVLDFCIDHFGRGLAVNVGAYPSGIPSASDAPFLWLFAEGEIPSLNADTQYTVNCIVGCCVSGDNGEKKIVSVVTERTDEANGLTVNGGNAVVEDLAELIRFAIASAKCGAILTTGDVVASDVSHFPLEWAEFRITFTLYASLND